MSALPLSDAAPSPARPLPFHPLCALFPLLPEDELQALAASIRQDGLHNPITTYQGQIIDGRNRYRACQMAGVPPRFQEWAGGTEADLLAFILSQNLYRRHLTAGQRAVLALELEEKFAIAAKERQAIGHYNAPQYADAPVPEKFPPLAAADQGEARVQAAALLHVNPHYVTDVKKLQQDAPDLVARIASGELNIRQAQDEWTARNRPAPPPPTPGRYRCIVIDPPWPAESLSGVAGPAPILPPGRRPWSLEALAALPVPDLADPRGCHLYLWVPPHHLPDGLELFRRWGARYQCMFAWLKESGVTPPDSWQYSTEHVLFGRIGHLRLLKLGLGLAFEAPEGLPGEKPDGFYTERVIPASPEPRLEMFARKPREGFTAWRETGATE